MRKDALIIFARNPVAGQVKSRLAATLGREAALAIYVQMLRHTASVTRFLEVDKFVFFDALPEVDSIWDPVFYQRKVQSGNDLGVRMKNAFETCLEKGYEQVAIIGTDCPGISPEIVNEAFRQLKSYDVVIGPARDGGYYLLGMKKLHATLFTDMPWSTPEVCTRTVEKCKAKGCSYFLLPELRDVDEVTDLY